MKWPGSLSPKILADGQAAIDAARAAGLQTPRERDYVEALAVFFKDADKLNHRTRVTAFETAMLGVASRYPDRQAVHEPAPRRANARADLREAPIIPVSRII